MDITKNPTALSWPLPAVDLDKTPVILRTIGEAANFLHAAISPPERLVAWQHAYKSLETAARDNAQIEHATKAVQFVLESERLLAPV